MRCAVLTFVLLLVFPAAAWLGPALTARAEQGEAPPAYKANFKREWTWARNDTQHAALQRIVGKPAPALSVGPWQGEAPPAMAELKGKIVLIDFWATWCGPCLRAIPHTNDLAKSYADRGVVVFGVCNTRGGEKMAATATKHQMKYPTAMDQSNASARGWGVQWWPFYVIIDRQGVVRIAGLQPSHVAKALDELLKEQPAP